MYIQKFCAVYGCLVRIRNFICSYSSYCLHDNFLLKPVSPSKRSSQTTGSKSPYAFKNGLNHLASRFFSPENQKWQPWKHKTSSHLHCEFEDVKLRVFEAAEQRLTCWVRDLVWHPPAAGVRLRNLGGSFPVLPFSKEEQLLFSCLHYLLDRMFRLVFGSLEDVGAQRRFPLVRNNLSKSPFPNPSLFQDKLSLNSKRYATAL